MVQPGMGGLDTPRTNIGDATYLERQPDFDISQELSFQSPTKDANLVHQLRQGGRPSIKTPRRNRAPFTDRRNLPAGLGGAEFTPLLKSATRNSARRHGIGGKENGLAIGLTTPAFLAKIDEDMTPMPAGETSIYGSRNTSSYMSNTPAPATDSDSTASTPMVMRRRGENKGKGPLEDGNQLSLREQENVIDKIEKENFGLKLKIHFLEEALRKAGPGFSEAALKENTELKVDKVTMHRELQRYKKQLTVAEKDLESGRQQILEEREKAKKKYVDENQRAELERLRQELQEKEADIQDLQRQIDDDQDQHEKVENLQDEIVDLEADMRTKDRIITEHEDKLEEMKEKFAKAEEKLKETERRMVELEEKAQASGRLEEAQETIEDLEANVRRLENQVDDMQAKLQDAVSEKDRAEADLEELQEELSNKSMVTKGLSRQVEEKITRLQTEIDKSRQDCSSFEKQHTAQLKEIDSIKSKLKTACQERDSAESIRLSLEGNLKEAQDELNHLKDGKALLQSRHDALTNESASLQREVSSLRKSTVELEESLKQERQHSLQIERDIRTQCQDEIDRLNDEISHLQADCREKENLYDNDSEKWETERHNLESERDHAEQRAAGLQRTIDKLRDVEGALSDKETRLQQAIQSETDRHKSEEAILNRQIEDLQQNLDSRQTMLEDLRNELSNVSNQLRQSQLDCQSQSQKVEALEDEVEILQATIDEESEKARLELEQTQQECEGLKRQLALLEAVADSARSTTSASQESAKQTSENLARLKFQLADSTENLARVTKERQALQDRFSNLDGELRSLRASLADTKAERDELVEELRRAKQRDGDTFKFDQERLDLRTAKTKLDSEVRRLKEENAALAKLRDEIETALENEMDRAAADEDRLKEEILQLNAKIRQSSEQQELSTARRTIRELQRRVEDYEARQATLQLPSQALEGNSELSILHRDLSAARQKELELLQHEASQKDTIKSLKRQIADLERKAHDDALDRLVVSPSSHGGSAQKAEISELRHKLSSAYQSAHDLKRSLRDAEHKSAATARELQDRLDELEEQKFALEQALDDAQVAAEEAAATHDQALKKYKHKLEKYKRERDELAAAVRDQQHGNMSNHSGISEMTLEERRDLHNMLRESQLAADKLDRQVIEQREALEELMSIEMALRKKLERARSERAAYRASAEKLQKDVRALKSEKDKALAAAAAANEERALVPASQAMVTTHLDNSGLVDTEAIIRASEAAERRHEKEIRGMAMQMEWLKACWDREAMWRKDAAFAKHYLLLEIQIRDACNKADLAIINRIRAQLNPSNRTALSQLSSVRSPKQHSSSTALVTSRGNLQPQKAAITLKRALTAVRFVVRLQISARNWLKSEKLRQRLANCLEDMEREERIKKMRDQWRRQVGQGHHSQRLLGHTGLGEEHEEA